MQEILRLIDSSVYSHILDEIKKVEDRVKMDRLVNRLLLDLFEEAVNNVRQEMIMNGEVKDGDVAIWQDIKMQCILQMQQQQNPPAQGPPQLDSRNLDPPGVPGGIWQHFRNVNPTEWLYNQWHPQPNTQPAAPSFQQQRPGVQPQQQHLSQYQQQLHNHRQHRPQQQSQVSAEPQTPSLLEQALTATANALPQLAQSLEKPLLDTVDNLIDFRGCDAQMPSL
jgi:hypothetical protein